MNTMKNATLLSALQVLTPPCLFLATHCQRGEVQGRPRPQPFHQAPEIDSHSRTMLASRCGELQERWT